MSCTVYDVLLDVIRTCIFPQLGCDDFLSLWRSCKRFHCLEPHPFFWRDLSKKMHHSAIPDIRGLIKTYDKASFLKYRTEVKRFMIRTWGKYICKSNTMGFTVGRGGGTFFSGRDVLVNRKNACAVGLLSDEYTPDELRLLNESPLLPDRDVSEEERKFLFRKDFVWMNARVVTSFLDKNWTRMLCDCTKWRCEKGWCELRTL